MLQIVSTLRRTIDKVDKKSSTKQLVNRLNNIESRLTQFEKETKPTISSIKSMIDKKVEEQFHLMLV